MEIPGSYNAEELPKEGSAPRGEADGRQYLTDGRYSNSVRDADTEDAAKYYDDAANNGP